MRRAVLVIAFVFIGSLVGHAQIVVYDGATTFRTTSPQRSRILAHGARSIQSAGGCPRLSMFTNLNITRCRSAALAAHAWENNERSLLRIPAALTTATLGSAYLVVSPPVLMQAALVA